MATRLQRSGAIASSSTAALRSSPTSPGGRSGHKTIKRKNVLFAGNDRRWATVATQTAKMNDVETPLSPLSYLVAFKTFLLVPPRINNEVPGAALARCPG